MATLQVRNKSYRVLFLHAGQRHAFTLGKVKKAEAEAKAAQVDYLLMRLKQGLVALPPGTDVVTFVRFDGKPPETVPAGVPTGPVTLASLRDRYLDTHRNGTLEASTLGAIETDFKFLAATLGERFAIRDLALADLQRHVDRRAKGKGVKGRPLSAATIRQEVVTLRTAWNWGVRMGLVSGKFPAAGLRYAKADEKPPFQTRAEVERRIARGGLTPEQVDQLWECVFLTVPEVGELLAFVREHASQPFVYPMVAIAAHTGMRRSELLRAEVDDVDLAGGTILVREKKRARGKRTHRRVPLSPFAASVLKDWLATHPGGNHLFAQAAVIRSKTHRTEPRPVTRDEAHNHLKATLAGSKWEKLRGYHVLRHSFVSNCAARGVDQRLIDEWVGHTTEEMRKRYRHLVPSVETAAIRSVFGE